MKQICKGVIPRASSSLCRQVWLAVKSILGHTHTLPKKTFDEFQFFLNKCIYYKWWTFPQNNSLSIQMGLKVPLIKFTIHLIKSVLLLARFESKSPKMVLNTFGFEPDTFGVERNRFTNSVSPPFTNLWILLLLTSFILWCVLNWFW